jgi:hypothetical protein
MSETKEFEVWLRERPAGIDAYRWSNAPAEETQYRAHEVQLAWDAWLERGKEVDAMSAERDAALAMSTCKCASADGCKLLGNEISKVSSIRESAEREMKAASLEITELRLRLEEIEKELESANLKTRNAVATLRRKMGLKQTNYSDKATKANTNDSMPQEITNDHGNY